MTVRSKGRSEYGTQGAKKSHGVVGAEATVTDRWQTDQARWSLSLSISPLVSGHHFVGVLVSKNDDLLKPETSSRSWLCAHRHEMPFPHLEIYLRGQESGLLHLTKQHH